ncbi:MAG: succinate dehydrogenase, hydrophobic membrane anchor protein [Micavibrio sp.]
MTHHHAHKDGDDASSCCCHHHGGESHAKGAALAQWVHLRLSAVILLPLTLWGIYSVFSLRGADHALFTSWLAAPLNAVLLSLFIIVSCYHGALGVQEIIEDYVPDDKAQRFAVSFEKMVFGVVALLSIVCIAKVAL